MQRRPQSAEDRRPFPVRLLSELRLMEREGNALEEEEGGLAVVTAGQALPLLWEQELGRLLSGFMSSQRPLWSSHSPNAEASPSSSYSNDTTGLRSCPESCSYLGPGRRLTGWQQVRNGPKAERWGVVVEITDYDPSMGRLSGVLEAHNLLPSEKPVTTFFEGEIVDNVNHSFFTSDYGACADTDLRHWSRFKSFVPLKREVLACGGRHPALSQHRRLYMRWKELFFVGDCESRLTIAGFYYVCLDRVTGSVEALYFDPSCAPDQHLTLQPLEEDGGTGHGFSAMARA